MHGNTAFETRSYSLTALINYIGLTTREESEQVVRDTEGLSKDAASIGQEWEWQALRLCKLIVLLGAVCKDDDMK